ncbi:hypothetical protein C6A85_05130, partial [Mycobacterium sp. ITM-2017-0098]
LLLWALPLLIAPPMYSKDVYSYLAQSEISLQGSDPYKVGPAPDPQEQRTVGSRGVPPHAGHRQREDVVESQAGRG